MSWHPGIVGLAAAGAVMAFVAAPRGSRLAAVAAWTPAFAAMLGSMTFVFGIALTGSCPGWPILAAAAVAAGASLRLVTAREPESAPIPRSPIGVWTHGLLGLAVLVAGFQFGWITCHRPLGSWDGCAIWNANAVHLARASDIPATLSALTLGHADYPLLVSGSLAWLQRVTGSESLAFGQGLALLFLAGLAASLFVTVARIASRAVAAAATAFLLLTPIVSRVAASQMADVPLAYLVLLATGGLALSIRADVRARWVVTSGLLVGCLGWTKNEGLAIAAVLTALFILFRVVAARRGLGRALLGFAAGAALPAAAIAVHRLQWAPANDLLDRGLLSDYGRLLDGDRYRLVFRALLDNLGGGGLAVWEEAPRNAARNAWGPAWIVLGFVALAVGRPRNLRARPQVAFFAAAFVVLVATWIAVYLLTPHDLEWHLSTSMDRLLLQIYPLAIVACFGLVGTEPVARVRPGANAGSVS